MNNIEKLMSEYTDIDYEFDSRMPQGIRGLYTDNHIYIAKHQTHEEMYETLAEELGHYLSSSGNILNQKIRENRKQERKARIVGAELILTPELLLECQENGCQMDYECAEYLGVTVEYFRGMVEIFQETYEFPVICENYKYDIDSEGNFRLERN